MSKSLIILLVIVLVGSLIHNFFQFNYDLSWSSEENQPFVIGIAAGVCGLLGVLIFAQYNRLKSRIKN